MPLPSAPLIFGLDLGTSSVGSAVLRLHEDDTPPTILRLGVRIFPSGRDPDSGEPLNAQRRRARLMRRQLRRKRHRRQDVTRILHEAGLLPAFGTADWHVLMTKADPYQLRARAPEDALPPHEAGRALYHLLKRSGFRSLRKPMSEDKEDEEGPIKKEILEHSQRLGKRTLGQYLVDLPKRRGLHLSHDMVLAEFDAIWQRQSEAAPSVFTDELRANLTTAAFARRPVFWRLDTYGSCRFVPGAPLCAKGSWQGQDYVLLQTVNSLRLFGGNERPLTPDERHRVVAMLRSQESATFGKLRSLLKLGRDVRFNLEAGGRDKLAGNAVGARLTKLLGKDWPDLAAAPDIRETLHDRLHAIHYRRVGNHRIELRGPDEQAHERAAFIDHATSTWRLPPDMAAALADLDLPAGWLRLSREAVGRLLPALETGLRYDEAVRQVFGIGHQEGPRSARRDRLDSDHRNLRNIRNPTVVRALNEMRKVVNNLIDAHGRPDVIRVELSRDLKLPPAERAEIDKRNRKRERERKAAEADLRTKGVAATPEAIDRWLLWKECKETCPYTGEKISFADLFHAGRFEVEHIIPRSRSLDDSLANKTLCERSANQRKGNRTPFEAFGPDANGGNAAVWEATTARVMSLLPVAKARKFLRTSAPEADDAFVERELRDTSYISRLARDRLKTLGDDVRVETTNGRVTGQLRRLWNLRAILPEPQAATSGRNARDKNRADHRHHAVDALVTALVTPAHVKHLSDHYRKERLHELHSLPLPWPDIRRDAGAKLARIVVSHRSNRKISGQLHKETRLGITDAIARRRGLDYTDFVIRVSVSDITIKNLDTVVDSGVRAALDRFLVAHGGTMPKVMPPYPTLPDGNGQREIRRVRTRKPLRRDLMVPMGPGGRSFVEAGENHHLALYGHPGEPTTIVVVQLIEAARRLSRSEAIIRPWDDEGRPLVMSLCKGDMLMMPDSAADGSPDIRVVTGFWASGQVVLQDHRDASGTTTTQPSITTLARKGARKISVDPIGRIRPAGG